MSLVSKLLYHPWGTTRYTNGTTPTDYGYTGQMKEGDIYYYGARWYDPAIGRFMQADTIVPMASQGTQAFDRYAYVNNNPILYRDENGHWVSTLVGGIIGAAVGYGVQVYQNIQSGLTVTDALTTNISAEKILAGAAAGAIAGTFLPLAASAISTTGLFTTGTAAATTMCADGDCTNEIELLRNSGFKTAAEVANSELGQTIARSFTHNPGSKTVSIGSFPQYLQVGESMNYTYLDMPTGAWNTLSRGMPSHFWKGINTAFMNQQIGANKVFVTAVSNPAKLGPGFTLELDLLQVASHYYETVVSKYSQIFQIK